MPVFPCAIQKINVSKYQLDSFFIAGTSGHGVIEIKTKLEFLMLQF